MARSTKKFVNSGIELLFEKLINGILSLYAMQRYGLYEMMAVGPKYDFRDISDVEDTVIRSLAHPVQLEYRTKRSMVFAATAMILHHL